MDGYVPQNGDAVFLGDSHGFMLIPSFLHLNTKLFADLPVHVLWRWMYSVLASLGQMVNGLVETATKSAFWVHFRLLEDVVLVPACLEALILGCNDKALGFCL